MIQRKPSSDPNQSEVSTQGSYQRKSWNLRLGDEGSTVVGVADVYNTRTQQGENLSGRLEFDLQLSPSAGGDGPEGRVGGGGGGGGGCLTSPEVAVVFRKDGIHFGNTCCGGAHLGGLASEPGPTPGSRGTVGRSSLYGEAKPTPDVGAKQGEKNWVASELRRLTKLADGIRHKVIEGIISPEGPAVDGPRSSVTFLNQDTNANRTLHDGRNRSFAHHSSARGSAASVATARADWQGREVEGGPPGQDENQFWFPAGSSVDGPGPSAEPGPGNQTRTFLSGSSAYVASPSVYCEGEAQNGSGAGPACDPGVVGVGCRPTAVDSPEDLDHVTAQGGHRSTVIFIPNLRDSVHTVGSAGSYSFPPNPTVTAGSDGQQGGEWSRVSSRLGFASRRAIESESFDVAEGQDRQDNAQLLSHGGRDSRVSLGGDGQGGGGGHLEVEQLPPGYAPASRHASVQRFSVQSDYYRGDGRGVAAAELGPSGPAYDPASSHTSARGSQVHPDGFRADGTGQSGTELGQVGPGYGPMSRHGSARGSQVQARGSRVDGAAGSGAELDQLAPDYGPVSRHSSIRGSTVQGDGFGGTPGYVPASGHTSLRGSRVQTDNYRGDGPGLAAAELGPSGPAYGPASGHTSTRGSQVQPVGFRADGAGQAGAELGQLGLGYGPVSRHASMRGSQVQSAAPGGDGPCGDGAEPEEQGLHVRFDDFAPNGPGASGVEIGQAVPNYIPASRHTSIRDSQFRAGGSRDDGPDAYGAQLDQLGPDYGSASRHASVRGSLVRADGSGGDGLGGGAPGPEQSGPGYDPPTRHVSMQHFEAQGDDFRGDAPDAAGQQLVESGPGDVLANRQGSMHGSIVHMAASAQGLSWEEGGHDVGRHFTDRHHSLPAFPGGNPAERSWHAHSLPNVKLYGDGHGSYSRSQGGDQSVDPCSTMVGLQTEAAAQLHDVAAVHASFIAPDEQVLMSDGPNPGMSGQELPGQHQEDMAQQLMEGFNGEEEMHHNESSHARNSIAFGFDREAVEVTAGPAAQQYPVDVDGMEGGPEDPSLSPGSMESGVALFLLAAGKLRVAVQEMRANLEVEKFDVMLAIATEAISIVETVAVAALEAADGLLWLPRTEYGDGHWETNNIDGDEVIEVPLTRGNVDNFASSGERRGSESLYFPASATGPGGRTSRSASTQLLQTLRIRASQRASQLQGGDLALDAEAEGSGLQNQGVVAEREIWESESLAGTPGWTEDAMGIHYGMDVEESIRDDGVDGVSFRQTSIPTSQEKDAWRSRAGSGVSLLASHLTDADEQQAEGQVADSRWSSIHSTPAAVDTVAAEDRRTTEAPNFSVRGSSTIQTVDGNWTHGPRGSRILSMSSLGQRKRPAVVSMTFNRRRLGSAPPLLDQMKGYDASSAHGAAPVGQSLMGGPRRSTVDREQSSASAAMAQDHASASPDPDKDTDGILAAIVNEVAITEAEPRGKPVRSRGHSEFIAPRGQNLMNGKESPRFRSKSERLSLRMLSNVGSHGRAHSSLGLQNRHPSLSQQQGKRSLSAKRAASRSYSLSEQLQWRPASVRASSVVAGNRLPSRRSTSALYERLDTPLIPRKHSSMIYVRQAGMNGVPINRQGADAGRQSSARSLVSNSTLLASRSPSLFGTSQGSRRATGVRNSTVGQELFMAQSDGAQAFSELGHEPGRGVLREDSRRSSARSNSGIRQASNRSSKVMVGRQRFKSVPNFWYAKELLRRRNTDSRTMEKHLSRRVGHDDTEPSRRLSRFSIMRRREDLRGQEDEEGREGRVEEEMEEMGIDEGDEHHAWLEDLLLEDLEEAGGEFVVGEGVDAQLGVNYYQDNGEEWSFQQQQQQQQQEEEEEPGEREYREMESSLRVAYGDEPEEYQRSLQASRLGREVSIESQESISMQGKVEEAGTEVTRRQMTSSVERDASHTEAVERRHSERGLIASHGPKTSRTQSMMMPPAEFAEGSTSTQMVSEGPAPPSRQSRDSMNTEAIMQLLDELLPQSLEGSTQQGESGRSSRIGSNLPLLAVNQARSSQFLGNANHGGGSGEERRQSARTDAINALLDEVLGQAWEGSMQQGGSGRSSRRGSNLSFSAVNQAESSQFQGNVNHGGGSERERRQKLSVAGSTIAQQETQGVNDRSPGRSSGGMSHQGPSNIMPDRKQSEAMTDWSRTDTMTDRRQSDALTERRQSEPMTVWSQSDTMTDRRQSDAMTGRRQSDAMTGRRQSDDFAERRYSDKLTDWSSSEARTDQMRRDDMTGRRQSDTITDRSYGDEVTDRRYSDAMTDRKQSFAVTDRRYSDKVPDHRYSDAMTDRKFSEPMTDRRRSDAITDRKYSVEVSSRRYSDAMTDRRQSNAVTDRSQSDAMTDRRQSGKVADHRYSDAMTDRKFSEPMTDRRQSDAITDRKYSDDMSSRRYSDAMTDRRQSNAMTDRSQSDAMTDRRQSDKVADHRYSDAMTDRKFSEPMVDRRQSDAITDRKYSDEVSSRRYSDAMTDRRQSNAMTDRSQSDAMTDWRQSEAMTDRRQSEAMTDRRQSEAMTDRRQSDAMTDRRQSEAMTGRRKSSTMTDGKYSDTMTDWTGSDGRSDWGHGESMTDRRDSNAMTDRRQSNAAMGRRQSDAMTDRRKQSNAMTHQHQREAIDSQRESEIVTEHRQRNASRLSRGSTGRPSTSSTFISQRMDGAQEGVFSQLDGRLNHISEGEEPEQGCEGRGYQ